MRFHAFRTAFSAWVLFAASVALAQCTIHVPWISGSAVVAGTTISVTPVGGYLNFADCGGTSGPYLCGDGDGEGGFVFTFSPPVDSLRLDFSALHRNTDYEEIMRVFVNGAHYEIPQASTVYNSCFDELAVLTAEGDVGAVMGGISSGWEGTIVPGPISTLAVRDSMPLGSPGGAFVSLFLCSTGTDATELGLQPARLFPNPASDRCIVTGTGVRGAWVVDASGRAVHAPIQAGTDRLELHVHDLAAGTYHVRVQSAAGTTWLPLVLAR